jgi:hypothetical protein
LEGRRAVGHGGEQVLQWGWVVAAVLTVQLQQALFGRCADLMLLLLLLCLFVSACRLAGARYREG